MHKRRACPEAPATLADGYRSIPALAPPKTEEEIAAIVAGERAERRRERIEREAKAEHVARTPANLRNHSC